MKIHTLASGATVLVTSPGHGFKFSDGTTAEPQDADICALLTCKRVSRKVSEIKGMALNETSMVLDDNQLDYLSELARKADIVFVPFPVLASLREMGSAIRGRFPTVVAMNATEATQRVAPLDKIVDINNWSY